MYVKTIKVSDQNHRRLARYIVYERTMDDVIGLMLTQYEKIDTEKKRGSK